MSWLTKGLSSFSKDKDKDSNETKKEKDSNYKFGDFSKSLLKSTTEVINSSKDVIKVSTSNITESIKKSTSTIEGAAEFAIKKTSNAVKVGVSEIGSRGGLIKMGSQKMLQVYDSFKVIDINKIIEASKNGNLNILKDLSEGGIKLDKVDNDGNSASHIASKYGHVDIVSFLIENNVFSMEKNTDNKNPLILASEYGFDSIIHLIKTNSLFSNEMDMNHPDIINSVNLASTNGHLNVLTYLYDNNLISFGIDKFNLNCFHYCIISTKLDCFNYLKEKVDEKKKFKLNITALQRIMIMRGGLSNINSIQSNEKLDDKCWFPPNSKLLIFVSSTFVDTYLERDILIEKISPEIRQEAIKFNIDVIFVDMRWGVRDENTKDQNTWIACRNEIERCKNDSDGLFFLSLQGDRYGYKPLPKFMSKKILDKLIFNNTEIDENISNIAKLNYTLDYNSIPPCYVLKNLDDLNDKNYWDNIFPNLMTALHHASITNFSDDIEIEKDLNDLLVGKSVTEYEIKYALQDVDSKQRIKWIHRHFHDEIIEEEKFCDGTKDEQRKNDIEDLKKYMNDKLNPSNVKEFSDINVASYLNKDDKCKDYLDKWTNHTKEILFDELSSVAEKRNEWLLDGFGVGMKGEVLEEILNHYKLANIKSSEFFGREKILDEALNIIFKDPIINKDTNGEIDLDIGEIDVDLTRESSIISKIENLTRSISNLELEEEKDVNFTKYEGITLALIGKEGSGKTSILSKLLEDIYLRDNCSGNLFGNRPVIIRFCGSTNESVSGLKLVTSIVHQIHFLFNCMDLNVPVKYEDLIFHFHMLLNKYELILIIDSVELLNDTDQARSHLSFLAGVKCHINTKIILSMLPDDIKSNNYYGCQTCCKKNHQLIIENIDISNESVGVSNVEEILTYLLKKQNRSLTKEQWTFVFCRIDCNPTILYLKLVSIILSQWRSSTPESSLILPVTVEATLNHILDQIERDFGKVFVRAAICFITFSIEGIRDNEMIDLLSLDDDVLESVFQYNRSNRLPSHVWFRLRFALSSFFVEKGNGCLNWYHRSLHDIAECRFTHDEILNSRILIAKYFGNIIDENLLSSRKIQPQPVSLNSIPVWFSDSEVNRRRCVEGFAQMINANLLYEAIIEMCNFDLICACSKIGYGFMLSECFSKLYNKLEMKDFTQNCINDELILKLYHFMLWINQDITSIVISPNVQIVATCSENQPYSSIARQELIKYIKETNNQNFPTNGNLFSPISWIRGVSLEAENSFGPLSASLKGHKDSILCLAITSDGLKVASGSVDCDVIFWDINKKSPLFALKGHNDSVVSISFNNDNSQIVSVSCDCMLIVWDSIVGIEKFRIELGIRSYHSFIKNMNYCSLFNENKLGFLSVSYSTDNNYIVTGVYDSSVRVYDSSNGDQIYKFEGHSAAVSNAFFTLDNQRIISSSIDGRIIFWKVSQKGNEIISSTSSSSSNIFTNPLIDRSIETNSMISCMRMSNDGRKLVIGNIDEYCRIYDINTGQELLLLVGHTGYIKAVVFSNDGNFIATSSFDQSIRIWDSNNGSLVQLIIDHSLNDNLMFQTSLCFYPDNKYLISASTTGVVKIWKMNNELQKSSVGLRGRFTSFCFSPEGDCCVCGYSDNTVRIWCIQNNIELVKFPLLHTSWIFCVAFAPKLEIHSNEGDNFQQFVASASNDCTIRIWNIETHLQHMNLVGHTKGVLCIAYNNSGSRLASGSYDNSIIIWDTLNGSKIKSLNYHSSPVSSVSFSPDGNKVCSGSYDKLIIIWNICEDSNNNEDDKMIIKTNKCRVNTVSFSPCGKNIVSGGSGTANLYLWDSSNGNKLKSVPIVLINLVEVNFISYNYDGSKILVSCSDKVLRIFDTFTFIKTKSIRNHKTSLIQALFSPDGNSIISLAKDSYLVHCKLNGEKIKLIYASSNISVTDLAYSNDGKLLISCQSNDVITFWDSETCSKMNEVYLKLGKLTFLAISFDSSQIAICEDKSNTIHTYHITDLKNVKKYKELIGHNSRINCLKYSNTSNILATGSTSSVFLWNSNGDLLQKLKLSSFETVNFSIGAAFDLVGSVVSNNIKSKNVSSINFLKDNNFLIVTYYGGEAKIWDCKNNKVVNSIKNEIHYLALNINQSKMATISFVDFHRKNAISLYDIDNGIINQESVFKFQTTNYIINHIDFSPCNKILLSCSNEMTIDIWEISTGLIINILRGHQSQVTRAYFSTDSFYIFSSSCDGTVRVWDSTVKETSNLMI